MGIVKKPDVVVIGAGAGGGAAAWRLCQKGLNVLLLDAGPRFDPQRDYKLDRPDWERHPFPVKQGSQGEFTIADLEPLNPENRDLYSWNKARPNPVKRTSRQPRGSGYSHVQGIGGSTLHFTGESHRFHPESMQLQSDFGVSGDWPLDYRELEPYYLECEKLIGVAGPDEQGARWRSSGFPLPAHPLSPSSNLLVQAGIQLGMAWQENSRAALSMPYDGRPACNYCANCNKGCPIGDKGSVDVTFIRHAEMSGSLQIIANAQVLAFSEGVDRRIHSVTFVENEKLQQVETPLLVLAAGAVQTPRLLLAHNSKEFPSGLANSSWQVGRNFMESLSWHSSGLVQGLTNSHVGLQSDAICWDFNAPDAIPGVIGGCRFYSATTESGLTGPIAYAKRVVSGFGTSLKQGVRNSFGHAVNIGAIGEFLPNSGSYVDLDPEKKNKYGIPYARIHSRLGDAEIKRLRFMAETCRKLLMEAGAEIFEEYGTYDSFSASHVFGTCRMGKDAAISVVNRDSKCHDIDNLYIVDASIFPSSGGGESPSLTIQALAVRAMDKIV